RKAGFSQKSEIDVQTYYDDTETMRIFRTASGVLGLSVDDMWEMYGEFLITYACETGWEKMLSCMANNLQEFLDNLNSMHYFIDQIAFKSEMRGPTFQCEATGRHLLVEYGVADKKMLKLSELVQIIQPADIQQLTHKNIMTYLNTLFIFQLKHHCQRNEVEKGSSEAFVQPLSLKGESVTLKLCQDGQSRFPGQMMPVNDGNYIIFLCSPHVTTVRDFVNLKLYLSDMLMYDATRDLVMLNQSRICQMELNKRLEETVRQLKTLAEDLERKKERTEHLLYEFVPPAIADSLRVGKPIAARTFFALLNR
ncbi:heme NO binding associated, partial [Teladorsagia circumcincta]